MASVGNWVRRKADIAKGMWTLGYEPLRVVEVPAECYGDCVIVEGDDRHWRTTNFDAAATPPPLGDQAREKP